MSRENKTDASCNLGKFNVRSHIQDYVNNTQNQYKEFGSADSSGF